MKKSPALNNGLKGIPEGWSNFPQINDRCPHTNQKGHWFYSHANERIKKGFQPDFETRHFHGKTYFNIQEVKDYLKNRNRKPSDNLQLKLDDNNPLKGWAKFPGMMADCPLTGMGLGWFNNHTAKRIREGMSPDFETKMINGRRYFNVQSVKNYMDKNMNIPHVKKGNGQSQYVRKSTIDPFWSKIQQIFIDSAISPIKGMTFQEQVKEEVYKMVIARYQAEKQSATALEGITNGS